MAEKTWPVVQCDQNDNHLFDIVSAEVAQTMPPGSEVVISFMERTDQETLVWGYACMGVVRSHQRGAPGSVLGTDVVVFVER